MAREGGGDLGENAGEEGINGLRGVGMEGKRRSG